MAKKPGRAVETGLYWSCPSGIAVHPRLRLGLTILQGPKAFLVRCPLPKCGGTSFLGRGWQANMGLTRAQALAQGLVILDDGV